MGLRQEVWEIHPDEFISRARKLHPVLKQRAQKSMKQSKGYNEKTKVNSTSLKPSYSQNFYLFLII